MSLKRRTFSKEFKLHVVRAVHSGRRPAEIARQYQILPKTISRWVVEYETYAEEAFGGKGHPYTQQAQAAALGRENARLRAENELLKKALRCLDALPGQGGENGDSA
jgi:transposase